MFLRMIAQHYEVIHAAETHFGRDISKPSRSLRLPCGEYASTLQEAAAKKTSADDYIVAVENGAMRSLTPEEEAQIS